LEEAMDLSQDRLILELELHTVNVETTMKAKDVVGNGGKYGKTF
jgi:hypothetical protein